MTIYFSNKTAIDIAAIEIMGVSVKEGASPIGYFGTGLKFAIATILRFNGSVTLWRNGEVWTFSAQPEIVREQLFDRVVMVTPTGEVRPLGFTTALGRNWQLWKAFRELESNCRDEGGVSGPQRPDFAEFGTVFQIEGLDEIWAERSEIFLPREGLLLGNELVEIHTQGKDKTAVYFRGVRAGTLAEPAAYTYNVLQEASLTEDRTIESMYWPSIRIASLLAKEATTPMLEKTLLGGTSSWEGATLHTWPEKFSDTFDEFISDHLTEKSLNGAAKQRWLSIGDNEEVNYKKAAWSAERIRQTVEALKLVRRMSEGAANLSFEDIHVVESLGAYVYGLARKRKIYLALQTYDMGATFLASTIYEEWLHINEGLFDESRSMQNRLFERLVTMTKRVMELEEATGQDEGTIFLRPASQDALPGQLPTEKDFDDIPF